MSAIMSQPTHDDLLAQARADHAQYPQYDGYFDEWVLARLVQNLVSKHGYVIAEKGTSVLMDPKLDDSWPMSLGRLARIWIPGDHVHAIYPHYVEAVA